MPSVTIKGKEYELVGEPSHGIARDVRRKQKSISVGFLLTFRNDMQDIKNKSVEEAMAYLGEKYPHKMLEYQHEMEDFLEIATISLATNVKWREEDFSDILESDFKAILGVCQKHLGGSATDFFGVSKPSSSLPSDKGEESQPKVTATSEKSEENSSESS
jgi:hypothetical protein